MARLLVGRAIRHFWLCAVLVAYWGAVWHNTRPYELDPERCVMASRQPKQTLAHPLTWLALLLVCVAVWCIAVSGTRTKQIRADLPVRELELAATVPAPGVLSFLALGHREALADLMWLNALSMYGASLGLQQDPSWMTPHLEAISGLDPRFELVYVWAATGVMYGGEINNRTVMLSNQILEQGMARFPASWELAFMAAVNYLVELRPTTDAERTAWRARGSELMYQASNLPGAPDFLAATAASVRRRQGDLATTLQAARQSAIFGATPAVQSAGRMQLERNLPASLAVTVQATLDALDRARTVQDSNFSPPLLLFLLHPDPLLAAPAGAALFDDGTL